MQDAAVPVVGDFLGSVDADARLEGFHLAVGGSCVDGGFFARSQSSNAFDIEDLVTGQAQGLFVRAREKFQRENAHANEIAAMDALVAFGENGADSEESRTFRGPIA